MPSNSSQGKEFPSEQSGSHAHGRTIYFKTTRGPGANHRDSMEQSFTTRLFDGTSFAASVRHWSFTSCSPRDTVLSQLWSTGAAGSIDGPSCFAAFVILCCPTILVYADEQWRPIVLSLHHTTDAATSRAAFTALDALCSGGHAWTVPGQLANRRVLWSTTHAPPVSRPGRRVPPPQTQGAEDPKGLSSFGARRRRCSHPANHPNRSQHHLLSSKLCRASQQYCEPAGSPFEG